MPALERGSACHVETVPPGSLPVVVVISGVGIAIGIAGTVLPILPGLVLVWLSCLAYGLVEGFGAVGWTAMVVISLLAAAGLVAGIRVPQRAAAAGGIGVRGQVFAAILAVVGFFVIPVVGAPLGFVVGVWLAARTRHGDRAWAVTRSTVRALVTAAGLQLAAGLGMGVTWAVWVVLG